MPKTKRKLRKKSVNESLEDITEDQKQKAAPWRDLRPFEGKDKLPDPVIDKSGRVKKVFKRYYMSGNALIAIYLGREGAMRRICKKTFHSTRPRDKQIRKALKKIGIPGA